MNAVFTTNAPEVESLASSIITPGGSVNSSLIIEKYKPVLQKRGQIIYHQGAYPFGVYFVASGVCKVYRESGDTKEKIIRFANAGDFLGYAELMGESPLGNSVEVLEDAEICFIPRHEFTAMLHNDPACSLKFMRMLCEELSKVETQLAITAYKPVKRRLAESLLSLYYSERKKHTTQGEISLSRTDLAQLVGTAKETVIRFLSEFRRDHLIDISGRSIFVTNPEALLRISEFDA